MSYPSVRKRDIAPRPRYMVAWERFKRNRIHLLTEMVAEMLGTIFYVYAGVGSTAAFVTGNLASQPIGSLFTIGVAYAIGIVLAITVCAGPSGGHFSPSVTISLVIYKGFPVRKAPMYILAQVFGSFLACLIIYVQWKDLITVAEGVLVKNGHYNELMFTPGGPAGIFALYVLPGTNLCRVLLNEFVTDFLLGLAICACIDPTNHFIPPAAAPWVIGFTYGMAVWGYSPTAIAANTARDLGGRLMAMTIWGSKAAGGPYGAIAALTNIPATLLAFFIYETFLSSSSRTLTPQHVAYLSAHKVYQEDNGLVSPGYLSVLEPHNEHTDAGTLRSFDRKPTIDNVTVDIIATDV